MLNDGERALPGGRSAGPGLRRRASPGLSAGAAAKGSSIRVSVSHPAAQPAWAPQMAAATEVLDESAAGAAATWVMASERRLAAQPGPGRR